MMMFMASIRKVIVRAPYPSAVTIRAGSSSKDTTTNRPEVRRLRSVGADHLALARLVVGADLRRLVLGRRSTFEVDQVGLDPMPSSWSE